MKKILLTLALIVLALAAYLACMNPDGSGHEVFSQTEGRVAWMAKPAN